MVMALAQERVYTVEDIYALPDGQRAELIDGRIFYMAPPGTRHQRLVNYLSTEINLYIREKGGSCEVFPAPFAVFLSDNKNYVEPDISVICDPGKLTEKGCCGAPDWIIEVVSHSSRSMDYYKKLIKYSTAGVREYWIADPDKNRVMVYRFEQETTEEYSFDGAVPAGIFDGFVMRFRTAVGNGRVL